ncbi:MAG: hypothetical protein KAG66_22150 [Methylococcales bacterium]|nr:hypothetical protein [Methylococcales bacterium]
MTNYSELPKVPPAWGDPLKIHTATGFVRRTHIARAVSLSILFSGAILVTLLDPEAVKQGDLPSVAVWGVLLLLSLAFLGWAIRLKHHKVAIYSKG